MIAVILAGGTGTRLWPYSRNLIPKQFLNLGSSQESLFQETSKRLESLVAPNNIYIVGADLHKDYLRKQILQIFPDFPIDQLLLEPFGRNTAPAILWSILRIPESNRNEPVVVLASDHLIKNLNSFNHALKLGERLASSGFIVTFGIKPDRAETGYGYIKSGKPLDVGFKVEEFVEKPDHSTAEQYLESNRYTWNASIFMATTETWLEEYREHAPELLDLFEKEASLGNLYDKEQIRKIYSSVSTDSIDYALLEKSDRVAVIPVDMEWTDLGSWESLHKVSEKDREGNLIRGNVISQDTKNSLIFSEKRLVACIGVENLIIVETDDALLVCNMNKSQEVKKLVETLKREERNEF